MAERICVIPDCEEPTHGLGLCWKHYLRVRRTGSAEGARRSAETRFFARVRKQPSGCWQWTGHITPTGYGTFTLWLGGKQKNYRAHRWAYEHFIGPIPDGLTLDHLCRNRACVNQQHLEPVTIRENTLRGEGFAAANASKTHCKRGHVFDEANTCIGRNGYRQCRTCNREKMRVRRRR